MTHQSVNSWELPDDDPLKQMIMEMNKKEELGIINNFKKMSKSEMYKNKQAIITNINNFINHWKPNTRTFHHLPQFIKELEDLTE